MKTIRNNTFETNSSSCHTVTICKRDTFERYEKGELICLVRVLIGQGIKAKVTLCDDNFYDIDSFYELIKKARGLMKSLPSAYCRPDIENILNSSKKIIWRIFFNGERLLKFDINELSNFILLGSYIFGKNIPCAQNIFNGIKIRTIKNSDGFIQIDTDMEDH